MEYEIKTSSEFKKWLRKLRDIAAKQRISYRIKRIQTEGYFGETKGVGDDVREIKFNIGPGYRVYYTIREEEVVFLLIGGDKSSQERDIAKAKAMAREI